MKLICNECGHRLNRKGFGLVDVKCPKCGGYDVEPA